VIESGRIGQVDFLDRNEVEMTQPPVRSRTGHEWFEDDPLIARYIEPHPRKPGVENARLARYGYSVWILIDALRAAENDVARIADEYDVPADAIRAALRFYRAHPAEIDAQINDHALFYGARR
jgi:uncharacterized protein (DUF433 family)